MGSALRVLNAGSEHIIAQSKIDAARILQKSSNNAKLSLVESQKIVQNANNAAADVYAANRRLLQDSSNALSLATTAGQKQVQAAYNEQAQALADAKLVIQASRNERAGVNSDIAKWSQSLSNQIKLDNTGQEINRITQEVVRYMDGAASGTIASRLANAEALGAQIATAAANGVGGSTMEAYNRSMSLRTALEEERTYRDLTGKVSDAYKARAQALKTGVNSLGWETFAPELDYSAITADKDYTFLFADQDVSAIYATHDFTAYSADLDYTQYIDHKKMSGFQQLATFAGAAAATYFGGPSAGMAVFDASNALYDFSTGNMAGAQSYANQFTTNFSGGLSTYRAGASGGNSGSPWGKAAASKIGAVLKI